MQLSINQKNLQSALRTVERVVAKNISLPILGMVLLKTEHGQLRITATNLELGIHYWVSARIDQAGEVAVPARIFTEFISQIHDEKLTIQTEQQVVLVSSDHYQGRILGLETKEFPLIPKIPKTTEITITGQQLSASLAAVLDAVATSEARPELAGVFLRLMAGRAEFAATDSFRLAEKIISLKNEIKQTVIIPRLTALELLRLSEEYGNQIFNLVLTDNQLFVRGENFEFVSRVVDGHYPEYKRVIPEKIISLARIKRTELEHSVKLASIFSSSISDIKLQASDGQLQIEAKNSDRGELNTKISCALKNEPFTIAVNFRYLLDGLRSLPGDNIILQYTGDGSPLVLRAEEDKDQLYLIMPLRN